MSIDPEYLSLGLASLCAVCGAAFYVGKLFFSLWSAQKAQAAAIASLKDKQEDLKQDFQDLNVSVNKVSDDIAVKSNEMIQLLLTSNNKND